MRDVLHDAIAHAYATALRERAVGAYPAKIRSVMVDGSSSVDRLRSECRGPSWAAGLLPHPTENVCRLRTLVEDAFDPASARCLLASSECVIVLVADGVSFDVARSCWSPAIVRALTSTCPTTTSTALLSATTGCTPAEHGVVGVAFYAPEIDAVFDCYQDKPLADAATVERAAREGTLEFGPWPTVFSALAPRVSCVAHVGGLNTLPGRWSRAVVHGARAIEPAVDWNAIANDPLAMSAAVAAEVDATLAEPRSGPLLVWAHVNIDAAIHLRGYDDAVREAVGRLGSAAERWAAQGHTVVAHADHGLVETHDSDRARRLMTLLQNPAWCRRPMGGAGRILWAHPRPGGAGELLERARDLADGFATLIAREELFRSGAMGETPLARQRIGEVVAVATGAEFPLFSPSHRFEHGAFSDAEMLVPLAIWTGR